MAQEAFTTSAGGTVFAYKMAPKERKREIYPVSTDSSGKFHSLGIVQGYLQLKWQNAQLLAENAALKEKVAAMQAIDSAKDLLEIRDIPREQAKAEIKAYFESHHGESIYPSDIMENLRLDYDLIGELCDELEKEGKIRGL